MKRRQTNKTKTTTLRVTVAFPLIVGIILVGLYFKVLVPKQEELEQLREAGLVETATKKQSEPNVNSLKVDSYADEAAKREIYTKVMSEIDSVNNRLATLRELLLETDYFHNQCLTFDAYANKYGSVKNCTDHWENEAEELKSEISLNEQNIAEGYALAASIKKVCSSCYHNSPLPTSGYVHTETQNVTANDGYKSDETKALEEEIKKLQDDLDALNDYEVEKLNEKIAEQQRLQEEYEAFAEYCAGVVKERDTIINPLISERNQLYEEQLEVIENWNLSKYNAYQKKIDEVQNEIDAVLEVSRNETGCL